MKHALLLGENPNPKIIPCDRWEKAVAFDDSRPGSGRWLKAALSHPNLTGWKFTLENAVTIHRVEETLPCFDAVVALSRIVSDAFRIPYVPHPAYYKRFHSREGTAGWARLLLVALNYGEPCPSHSQRLLAASAHSKCDWCNGVKREEYTASIFIAQAQSAEAAAVRMGFPGLGDYEVAREI